MNELYVTSTLAGDDTSADERAMDEKRKARVRGLLEQIPIDSYVEGGKGDPEYVLNWRHIVLRQDFCELFHCARMLSHFAIGKLSSPKLLWASIVNIGLKHRQ